MTAAQMRVLAQRVAAMPRTEEDRDLQPGDLKAMGYGEELASRILRLLEDGEVLENYLRRGNRQGCVPISRVSPGYPVAVRKRLGLDSPCCLWAKGNVELLNTPKISLVGSRQLQEKNREFAMTAGREAARQGYTLVSGNARGADREAQEACLAAGGRVISVVADSLEDKPLRENLLYLSEDGFDQPFSTIRALSRNRVIHCLGQITLVAQCGMQTGGTWDGTVKNLRFGWSDVFCFRDGSEGMALLEQMGAGSVTIDDLQELSVLPKAVKNLFDQ